MRAATLLSVILMLGMCGCASNSLQVPHITEAEIARERANQYALLFESIRASSDYAKEQRLINITYPLLRVATEMCPERTTYHYGVITYDPTRLSKAGRAAREQFQVEDGLRVLYVVEPFRAAEDIVPGDVITAVNGTRLAGLNIEQAHNTVSAYTETGAPVEVDVMRDGAARSLTLRGHEICRYPHEIKRSEELNAYADGQKVYVTASLLDFAESDDELALVMAHEISHNMLEHTGRNISRALMGAIRDAVIAGTVGGSKGAEHAGSDEAQADYLGIYIMTRAGFDATRAAGFWRRMALANPETLGGGFATRHPSTPERFVLIEKTLQEIAAKRRAGLSLDPEQRASGGSNKELRHDG